jgi:hypothetical protein
LTMSFFFRSFCWLFCMLVSVIRTIHYTWIFPKSYLCNQGSLPNFFWVVSSVLRYLLNRNLWMCRCFLWAATNRYMCTAVHIERDFKKQRGKSRLKLCYSRKFYHTAKLIILKDTDSFNRVMLFFIDRWLDVNFEYSHRFLFEWSMFDRYSLYCCCGGK